MKTVIKMEDKIFELKRKCYSIKEIAKEVHKRDRYVSAIIKANKWEDVGVKEVVQLRSEGNSIKKIAKLLKINDRIVSAVVNRFNIENPKCNNERKAGCCIKAK